MDRHQHEGRHECQRRQIDEQQSVEREPDLVVSLQPKPLRGRLFPGWLVKGFDDEGQDCKGDEVYQEWGSPGNVGQESTCGREDHSAEVHERGLQPHKPCSGFALKVIGYQSDDAGHYARHRETQYCSAYENRGQRFEQEA